MSSLRRVWYVLCVVSLLLAGVTGATSARADQAGSAPPGCAYTGALYANCVQAPLNYPSPDPAPAVTWTTSTNGAGTTSVTGRFTATITPAYATCTTVGNYPASELPCVLQGALHVNMRLYVPGADQASYGGISAEPVTGTCSLTSCDIEVSLYQPYYGPGTLILTVSETAILRSGAFEGHQYELPISVPGNPIHYLAHPLRPQTVFHGTVRGAKKVSLSGHGVPAKAEGVFAIVTTVYPRTSTSPALTTTDPETVKGTSLRITTARAASVTVRVTGWVDASSSAGGTLRGGLAQQRITGSSAIKHLPSNATAVIVSAASPKLSIVGGVPVQGSAIGMVLPLSNGRLAMRLSKGARVVVSGYFAPAEVTDLDATSYISGTGSAEGYFNLSSL